MGGPLAQREKGEIKERVLEIDSAAVMLYLGGIVMAVRSTHRTRRGHRAWVTAMLSLNQWKIHSVGHNREDEIKKLKITHQYSVQYLPHFQHSSYEARHI